MTSAPAYPPGQQWQPDGAAHQVQPLPQPAPHARPATPRSPHVPAEMLSSCLISLSQLETMLISHFESRPDAWPHGSPAECVQRGARVCFGHANHVTLRSRLMLDCSLLVSVI